VLNLGGSYWDRLDHAYLRDEFLRSPEEGVEHPARRFVRAWLEDHPGLVLLDIGCGPGVEYEGFIRYCTPVRYIGMDASHKMRRAFHERFPNADIRGGNITRIPLSRDAVDIVLARHILEHVKDYHDALKECLRVSRAYVIAILFKEPYITERRPIGWGSWENRLDIREVLSHARTLGMHCEVTSLPFPYEVPHYMEPNTAIVLRRPSRE
jgi:SAM-dependent methyltransferase